MTNLDQVILVNQEDEQIGVMDKIEAHRGQGKLHRAVSVFLFDDKQQLLVQQRSHQKIVGAAQWANTCCGNVRPNESYQECAYRRLKEELGITQVKLQPAHKFSYFAACNEEFSEREIDQVFVGRFQGQVQPNPEEVAAIEWVDWASLVNRTEDHLLGEKELAPWFVIMLEKPELRQSLVTALASSNVYGN